MWELSGGSDSKESAYNSGDLGWEDPPEKGMADYPLQYSCQEDSTPGMLQPMGLQKLDTTERLTLSPLRGNFVSTSVMTAESHQVEDLGWFFFSLFK